MGWRMGQLEPPAKFQLMGLHKSLGLLALILIGIRIVLRLTSAKPEQENTLQGKLAHIAHILLYGFMLIIPLSGLVMSWAGGHNTAFFSLFTIPGASEKLANISGVAHSIHVNGIYLLGSLIVLHIAGFIYHHFVQKDNLIERISLNR